FLTCFQYKKAEESYSARDKIELITQAIASKSALQIVYLKPNGEKTRRTVVPESVGEMEYQGRKYVGMRAFCLKRNEERTFRIDRILEIKEA
ncbi:MAG: AAA family ATPase, partial [Chloroflexi bacterium]